MNRLSFLIPLPLSKSPSDFADRPVMSSISSISGPDMAASIVASQQAQIAQQAALKAAKMTMDIAKDSGTRLIESLIKTANANAAAVAKGSIDVLA